MDKSIRSTCQREQVLCIFMLLSIHREAVVELALSAEWLLQVCRNTYCAIPGISLWQTLIAQVLEHSAIQLTHQKELDPVETEESIMVSKSNKSLKVSSEFGRCQCTARQTTSLPV